jgi:pimeloyl-ACP methyl ester carboxylesterase
MRCGFLVLLAIIAPRIAPCFDVQRGAPLPRKGFLGVATATAPNGLKVSRVFPGGSGEKLGLKADDVLTLVNGQRLTDPAKLVALVKTLHRGDKIEVRYLHDGKVTTASAPLAERPRQTEQNLDVIYDQVQSLNKRIRVIITKPKGEGKFPTLFLIGGIGSYSVDAPFSSMPYGNVIGPIANAGYVTVRIDKPGQGDSEGPADYKNLSFNVEADAYLQALRLAKTLPCVDPNKIVIYGHSMGGCFAPVVASEEPVKAVIANGTLFKSFTEYMLENTRRQAELSQTPEDQLDSDQKQLDALMYFVFDLSETPASVIKNHPELAAFAKQTFSDGETYSGVGIPFFRELNHINLPKAWSGVKADVLALYGENDFLSGRDDHERIAAYVNKLRPGTAEFKLLPLTDHVFAKTTSMRDSMDKWGKASEFNPLIVQTLLDYLKKEIG